ncbi:MAG: M20/M25/M40 family metallo-hydrolase [Acidobacteria bacterium]|nr:M20/M25/M40 family metallo-hydrolase [Acidobacteriota bacterium]
MPDSAAPTEFSSGRAMKHLRAIAQKPHPTGSQEHERVREYIVAELSAHGLEPSVQEATVVLKDYGNGRPVPAGTVRNVVARMKGTDNSTALMLAAHYDSVPTAPGASDDGAGVVTLLETLRALKAGPPLKNDVIFLFTDGEELGLLGAHAFVAEHPWMRDVGLVLNFEARGAGGPSMMFETSEGNGTLIRELARTAPHVVASSLMYAVYKRLPNDTDMTVFKEAGAAGLNFAYADRITSYHTQLDSVSEIDERSLQHHGSYALALSRGFGGLDLRETRAHDSVYFNVLGDFFASYSEAWVVPLTLLVMAVFLGVMFLGWKKKRITLKGLAGGFVLLPINAACAGLAAQAAWWVVRRMHAPLLYMLFMMLGLALVGYFCILLVLLVGLLLPLLHPLIAAKRWPAPVAALLAGTMFIGAGLLTAGFDAHRRKVDSVFYYLNADTNQARWISTDVATDSWTQQFIPPGAKKESITPIFPWANQADAPAVALPSPNVEVLDDQTSGDARTVRLRLFSARRAPMLLIFADAETEVLSAFVNGKHMARDGEGRRGETTNSFRLAYAAPASEGIELLLEVRASRPLRLTVQDISYELPQVPGQNFTPRPDDAMPVPSSRTSDTTLVSKTFNL